MPARRTLLTGYLLLLALSSGLRAWTLRDSHELEDDFIRAGLGSAPAVLVLPGAGQAQEQFKPLVEALGDSFRVLVYDHRMGQHRDLVTYEAQGTAILTTLDRFHWPEADLIAFGTSGGTALTLAARAPDRIRSVILVEASGVEEFDLLGEHHLNRVLRSAQWTAGWMLRTFVPHFGVLDQDRFRRRDLRVLLANDRRTLRAAIPSWTGPTLIINARHDPTYPAATAIEHARLIPQAELDWYDGALVQGRIPTPFLSARLHPFLAAVEHHEATTRADAPPDRVTAATRPFDAGGLASAQGVSLIVVLALLALATLLSEDLACVTAGVLAARGSIPLWPGILACYIGIVIGDQLLYLLGRSAGRALVTRVPLKWILSSERLDRAYEWFRTHGMKVVLTSRLLPGTRSTVYVAAGILRAGFVKFALWLVVIGAVWTPALVGLSYVATRQGRGLLEALPGPTWPWALGAVVGGTLLIRSLLSAATPEGRASLRVRWRGVKAAG